MDKQVNIIGNRPLLKYEEEFLGQEIQLWHMLPYKIIRFPFLSRGFQLVITVFLVWEGRFEMITFSVTVKNPGLECSILM